MRNLLNVFIPFLLLLSCRSEQKPNVVYILADDLGIGDVSAYNEKGKIATPNIDELAAGGMMFSDAHSGSAVCTPTRYGIMTGRYSWRGTLKKGVTWSYDSSIVEDGRLTVGNLMKQAGYQTACIGKWHLGLNWADSTGKWPVDFDKKVKRNPTDLGFDYSFVIPASLDIPPYVFVENDQLTAQPDRETESKTEYGWWRNGPTGADFEHKNVLQTFADKAVSFINSNKSKPFFLYLPLAAPHTPILPDENHLGKSGLNEYGDFVTMVDDVVGQVIKSLKDNGLDENTLVIFTSDNGCAPYAGTELMERAGHFSSLNYRGYKADIYEGGHRIPFIAKWNDHIAAGSKANNTTCLTDLMATLADLMEIDLPENAAEDSFSLLPVFWQNGNEFKRNYTVNHSINGTFAIRKENWKLILAPDSGGWSAPKPGEAPEGSPIFQLYDLAKDPAEQNNLMNDFPEKVEELKSLLKESILKGRSTPGKAQAYSRIEKWPGLDWMENE